MSSILYNIYTSRILEHIGSRARATVYVDAIFLYRVTDDINSGLEELQNSVGSLSDWLTDIGMSVSVPKCHLCCFTRSKVDFDVVSINIGDQRIQCKNSIKYLGIILDSSLN